MKKPAALRKRIRLKGFDYKGAYRYFVTICSNNKKAFFNDDALVSWLVEALREKSGYFGFKVWAWCFMPDHLHLLVEGVNDSSDMRRFVSSYKQHTGFYYKKKAGVTLWQANYYEHVLRKEEDTTVVARYIFDNPLRKGLVLDYMQYGYLGSFELDPMEL